MNLLKAGPCYTPLEYAIVLLGIDVERFLVDRRIILYLVHSGLRLAMILATRGFLDYLLLLLDVKRMRRSRDRS